MKEKRNAPVLAGAVLLVMVLAGCAALLLHSRNRNEQGQPQKRIGAVYMTMNNPYFEVVDEKIKAVVRNRGDVMVTRDSALDAEMQNRQIEAFVEEGVDLILVNAVDWDEVRHSLATAKEAGVPVLAVDAEVSDPSLVEGSIISDNYNAGVLCAEDLMNRRESGKILFLVQSANSAAVDRIRGFRETLDAAGWPYRVVGQLECQGQLEIAQPMVEQVLRREDDIDVVMGLNDPSALGAMAALDAAGRLQDVLVYGVDGAPEAKTMIYEKRMAATAAQSPVEIGEKTAKLLYDVLEGKEIPEKTVVPVQLITQENIGRFNLSSWE